MSSPMTSSMTSPTPPPTPPPMTSPGASLYAVEVRDRIMIAHSLPDPFFGPAQNLHGASLVVDVAFFCGELSARNVVVDIGAAGDVLKATLQPLAYQNLDALEQFKGKLTTTEYLCRYIFDAIAKAASAGALGEEGRRLAKIRVTLQETDVARAAFEGPLPASAAGQRA
jgi:6-pyruvoyl-tetrahydropterin synthase